MENFNAHKPMVIELNTDNPVPDGRSRLLLMVIDWMEVHQ